MIMLTMVFEIGWDCLCFPNYLYMLNICIVRFYSCNVVDMISLVLINSQFSIYAQ